MKSISIFNQKGGVGKSTTTANIAGCLSNDKRKRVLVVDCDGQSNVSNYLLTNTQERSEYSLIDYFKNPHIPFDKLVSHVYVPDKKNLKRISIDVLRMCSEFANISVQSISVLKDLLDLVSDKYDYCLMDCPPHISDVALNALCASDYVIVPANTDDDSLGGYSMLVDTINGIRSSGYNVGVEIVGIILNNMDESAAFDKYIYGVLNRGLGRMIFNSHIRSSKYIKQSRHMGVPMTYFRPKADVTEDYRHVTDELLSRIRSRERN